MCGELWIWVAALLLGMVAAPAAAQSIYLIAPPEPNAVTVMGKGDGKADDGPAIQRAISQAADKGGGGIVFLPSGTYRISKTLFLWPGVRIFGVGAQRPVILLGANTPGFQRGLSNMLIFAGARERDPAAPGRVPFPPPGSMPFNPNIADANPGTFYSALSNIDFRIGPGNPAAAAIRFHAAQHAHVSHAEFDIGSGLAGLYHVANYAEKLVFRGGRYGILAEKTSPAWPFALVDATFEGQRDAAIREHETGLTMVNVSFRDTPVGVEIDEGYGDWLWGQQLRFENVSRAAVLISNENNVYTQVGFQDVVAANTPTFARFRESGRSVTGKGRAYRVSSFTYGLTLPSIGEMGVYQAQFSAETIGEVPRRTAPAIRPLPPVSDWVDVRAIGAKGDDKTDDTAAIQRAIDGHRVVYFPSGFYHVSDTLRLRPDSVLIGLHPSLTQIILPDRTTGFQGVGPAKALVQSAVGGDNLVIGLGLNTNGVNPRATALLWTAGASSLVADVKFQGGHGTNLFDGTRLNPYNGNQTGDLDPVRRWDGQYASLWVTNGGGGTFANIWSPSTFGHPGIYISDTETPGRIIQASVEHHVRTEIGLNRVANWELLAPQTEGEAGESGDAVALEIRNSRNILVANLHAYRVTRTRKAAPAAVTLYDSHDIRFRNVHVNGESGVGTCDEVGCFTFLRLTKFPFENAIHDITRGVEVRERQFAALDVKGDVPPPAAATFDGSRVEMLADGFHSLGGAAIGPDGTLYFVDRRMQRIYAWSDGRRLEIVRDQPLDPVNLAADRSGNLMVLSASGPSGTVYSFKPGSPDSEISVIEATSGTARTNAAIALPANWWANGEFRDQLDTKTYRFRTLAEIFSAEIGAPNTRQYVSPDGSLVLPDYRTVVQGPPDFRAMRFSHALDTYGLVTAEAGGRVLVTNASENRTYSGLVNETGAITDLKIFADRGGESVAAGPDGRVYVANGQLFVYSSEGRPIGRIDVPDRPLQLIFGGAKRDILYVLTHHALYAVRRR